MLSHDPVGMHGLPRKGGSGWKKTKKMTSTSTERQKCSQNLAPVLATISANSLVFSRKIITSTGFYWCRAAGASAPVEVKKSVSHKQKLFGLVVLGATPDLSRGQAHFVPSTNQVVCDNPKDPPVPFFVLGLRSVLLLCVEFTMHSMQSDSLLKIS